MLGKAEEHLTTALAAATHPWMHKHADTLEEALQTTKAHVERSRWWDRLLAPSALNARAWDENPKVASVWQ